MKIWRKFPTHPSIRGFELHNSRDGKSVSSESVSKTTSTSEITSVGKKPANESVAIDKKEVDNVLDIVNQEVDENNDKTM